MNGSQVRKADKLDREDVFITDSAADFPAASAVASLTTEINAERQKLRDFDAAQASGFGEKRSSQGIFEERRDRIVDLLDKFVLAGAIVEDEIEGTAAKFKNPYPRSNEKLIARCTSFFKDSADIWAEMKEAGMDDGDRDLLITLRDEFQGAGAGRDSGETHHAGASGGMTASFRKAMELSAKRGKRVKMKYRNNPEKLAAWAVASHLDRAPKRSTPPAPATP